MTVRPSTMALLSANVGLLAALAWIIMLPAQPHWLAPQTVARATEVPARKPLPMLSADVRAATWKHPIFSPDRLPDPLKQAAATQALASLTLTGVFVDGASQWAYLREHGKPATRLSLGATLDNGWTLSQLTALTATFTRNGQAQTLSMPMLRLPPPSKASALTLPRTQTP